MLTAANFLTSPCRGNKKYNAHLVLQRQKRKGHYEQDVVHSHFVVIKIYLNDNYIALQVTPADEFSPHKNTQCVFVCKNCSPNAEVSHEGNAHCDFVRCR